MVACPNINNPDWKALVEAIGEDRAYIEYYKYGDIPSPDLYFGLKKENNIKPGVSELFESNPELANAVYEALGFKNVNLIKITDNAKEERPEKNIIYKGEKIGEFVENFDTATSADMGGISIKEEYRNKGIGKTAYLAIAQYWAKQGKKLVSNKEQTNSNSSKVWESLIRDGFATQTGNTYSFISPQQLLEKLEQQKQQAQQLYSQYLSTIFPDSKVKDIVYHGSYSKNIDKFSKDVLPRTSLTGFLPKGFYFTNQQYVAATYTAPKDVYNKAVWSSLVNFIEGVKDEYGNYLQEPESFEKLLSYIGKSDNQKEFIIDYRDGKLEDSFGGAAEDGLFLPSKEDTELYLKFIKNKDLEGIKKKRDEYSSEEGKIYPSILNIKIPLYKKTATGSITTINLEGRTTGEKKITLNKELKNSDGLVISDIRDSSDYKSNKNIKYDENINEQTYVVFEPEQIHILGSKQDIEGFREFVKKPNTFFNKSNKSTPLSIYSLTQLSNSFFKKLKVPFKILTREEANNLGIPKDANGAWQGNSNTVYLIEGESSADTAIHEFTHPFVEWIYQNNPALFKTLKNKLIVNDLGNNKWFDFLMSQGYSDLIKEGQITDNGWKEILTHEITKASREIINDSNLENEFVKSVKVFWTKIKQLLKDLTGIDLTKLSDKAIANISIKDLATIMMDKDFTLDLSNVTTDDSTVDSSASSMYFSKSNTTFTSAVSAEIKDYKNRTGKPISQKQLDVLNLILQKQHINSNDDNYYDSVTNTTFERATSFLSKLDGPNKEKDFYGYKSEEDFGLDARAYGNQIDKLAELILLGVDKETSISEVIDYFNNTVESEEQRQYKVSEKVLSSLYDELKSLFNTKYKDYIRVPQVILANEDKKVAGRVDILLISPEGRLKIVDVKTTQKSMYDFLNQKFSNSSPKQKYTAQLSIYKGLAKSMGLIFEETNDLSLVVISLDKEGSQVEEAKIEPELQLNAYSYILNMFSDEPLMLIDEFESSKEGMLIKRMKLILTERLDNINRQSESTQKKYAKKDAEELLALLNQAEPIKKLTEFVNALYKQFQDTEYTTKDGKTRTNYGLASQISYLGVQVATGKLSKDEAFSKLKFIKTIRDLYAPLLPDISLILSSKDNETLRSEMLNKITEIGISVKKIEDIYDDISIDLLTNMLSENVSSKANQTVISQIEALKKRISTSEGKQKEKYKKELDSLVERIGSEEGVTKDVIRKSLKEGSRFNIGFLDRWFTPAASSSNEIIGTFSRVLKDKLEDARQSLIDFEKKAANAFEKMKGPKDNPAEFNKGLYEEVRFFDGIDSEGKAKFKTRMAFVSEIDLNALELEKAKFFESLEQMEPKDKANAIRNFYNKNYELRPKEDVIINGVVVEKGLNTLLQEKRKLLNDKVISQSEFDSFEKSLKGYNINGVTYYNKDLLLPKKSRFTNSKYKEITGDKKEYYNFLISSYFKAQERYPHKMGYILPSIHKSGYDSIREGGLKRYISYELNQLKNITDEDVSRYGENQKVIPMSYNFDMDANDVSLDLITSIVLYEAESLEYKAKSEVADSAEVLLSIVEKNAPYDRDGLNNKYLNKFAEQAGITDELLKYQKIFNGNNVAALLSVYIDAQIYGKLNVKTNLKVLGINVDKLTNSIMNFASVTQVGGNPIGSVANSLQAKVQTIIESAAKDKVSDKAWLKSGLIYDQNIPNYIKDFNEPYNKSFIGQLVDAYDPMQGEYKDAAGRRISKSMFKKLWSSNTWFFMQHLGEHGVQVRTMIAMMLDTKVQLKDGTITNLYELHKNEFQRSGKIKIPEGTFNLGKLSENKRISRDFQASLHALNKRLQGVYNKQDKPDIERYWYGRLLTMYKKFLAPGLKRRYKSAGIDFEYGDLTEGYWITFKNKMLSDIKELSRFIIGVDNQYFTEFEKQNLRRARRELIIVFLTGLAVIALKGLLEAADDDEKRYYRYVLFLTMRLNNELGIYGTFGDPQNFGLPNPGEMYKTIKNPFPAMSVTNKLASLFSQLTDPTAVYERDSGIWEKGDSKLWAKFLKFWGYNGLNYDPENSIKYMEMASK